MAKYGHNGHGGCNLSVGFTLEHQAQMDEHEFDTGEKRTHLIRRLLDEFFAKPKPQRKPPEAPRRASR